MAAMALGLGVRLGKPGAYVLHAEGRVPNEQDTFLAVNSASKTTVALCLMAGTAIYSIAWMRSS
jgi:adenosylcobinamide-phosphate synthase